MPPLLEGHGMVRHARLRCRRHESGWGCTRRERQTAVYGVSGHVHAGVLYSTICGVPRSCGRRLPRNRTSGLVPFFWSYGSPTTFGFGIFAAAKSCAWTDVTAAMLTTSFTVEPRCSTFTGASMPMRIGPIASAPASFSMSL